MRQKIAQVPCPADNQDIHDFPSKKELKARSVFYHQMLLSGQ
jgi:hypothetical protein